MLHAALPLLPCLVAYLRSMATRMQLPVCENLIRIHDTRMRTSGLQGTRGSLPGGPFGGLPAGTSLVSKTPLQDSWSEPLQGVLPPGCGFFRVPSVSEIFLSPHVAQERGARVQHSAGGAQPLLGWKSNDIYIYIYMHTYMLSMHAYVHAHTYVGRATIPGCQTLTPCWALAPWPRQS